MSPKDRGRNCDLCQLPQITGFADVELGRDIEVVPALTASQTDTRDPNLGSLMPGASQSDVGVTVSWGITPDITANLALNPDFSQVEADAAQLDVNNQFALQFPETRPFFLEGADFFSTPINAVFTRTISDPDIGAKLTGRRGASTFGAFAAEDTLTNLLFPGALGSASHTLNETNDSFVGRYQFGFGESSAIGALVTNRSAAGYSNRVAGFDGRYRITGEHSLRFQYLNSETEYPDSIATDFDQPLGRFSGNALNVNYNYGTRNWSGFVNYRRFDPDFRADSGFVSQVDFENRSIGGARIWHGEGNNWWNMFRVGGNTGSTHDISGQLLSRFWETFLALQGPYQSFVQSGTGKSRQFWNGQLFDRDFFFVFGQIRPNGSLNFQMSIQKGDQIDFANSRLGKQLSINPQITWNVNRHLLVRLRHTSRQLDTQEGEKIFDATLDDLRLTWQFNVRNFLRLTVQRQDIERNLDAFTSPFFDAQSVSMGRQLLYSYKLNPQTVVFAGYSDNLIENDTLTTLTKTDRTFFLKFSYAWIP